jgi:hypothetical protein
LPEPISRGHYGQEQPPENLFDLENSRNMPTVKASIILQ